MDLLDKLIKAIMWFIDTFKVAISIVLVIMLLSLVGCANLESLVHKEEHVSRETSLIRIGEKTCPTERERERIVANVSLSFTERAKESTITMEVVVV